MSTSLETHRPQQPAARCVKCNEDHQPQQHRVVHSAQVSLFANAVPLFNQPYGTEEVKLKDAWFYASLHAPLNAVLATLTDGLLPWLCPHCAGYSGKVNQVAPGATVLNDDGHQVAIPVSARYEQQRADRQRKRVTLPDQFRASAG
ncbi:hypothetical protein ACR0ST_03370 [Aliidiomarina sp. Khilg15.8]